MTQKELSSIREFVDSKSTLLMKYGKKPFAKINFDVSHYFEVEYLGRKFVIIGTNVFYQILNSVLVEACKKYPEKFGNDDINEVLQAIYLVENVGTLDNFFEFLKNEQFAWILELVEENVSPHILRVELFRDMRSLKNGEAKNEFIGGVFHSFKHFTYKGVPLSTKKENKEIDHPRSIIEFAIQGFFFMKLQKEGEHKYQSKKILPCGNQLCFFFYKDINTEIFFINSVVYKK
jgi:hypothetical protein